MEPEKELKPGQVVRYCIG